MEWNGSKGTAYHHRAIRAHPTGARAKRAGEESGDRMRVRIALDWNVGHLRHEVEPHGALQQITVASPTGG